MDAKRAIEIAKVYVRDVLGEEEATDLEVEEVDRDLTNDNWLITLAFSRRWSTPRTRAQELLESLGGTPGLRRTAKVFTVTPSGEVLSMKSPVRT